MPQLYHQASQQGVWTCLGPPQSAAFMLAQSLSVTYGDGTQDTLAAHVPAVTSAGTTQVDRTGAVWLLYVVAGDPTLRIVREMDQAQVAGSYAPLARVLADRVVPYQPDNGQAQSSTSAQSFLPLTITNNSSTQSIGGSSVVPVSTSSTDYVVQCHLTGSTAGAVWNALSDKTSFGDLQVIFAGAEIDADIDQATNGAWSSSNQTLWFRLQRPIAALGTDQGYQLRVGGGVRSSPPRSWANIYPLADDFLGSSLSGGTWTTGLDAGASAVVSASVLTLSAPTGTGRAIAASTATFGPGYAAAARAILPAYATPTEAAGAVGLRTLSGVTLGGTFAEVVSDNLFSSTNVVGAVAAGGAATTTTLLAADAAYHVFAVARTSGGSAQAWRDGAAPTSLAGGTTSGALSALCFAVSTQGGTAPSAQTLVDWLKVRPFCSPEPSVVAGTLQSAGGLRWEPITTLDGSVLVDSQGAPIMALVSAA